MDEAILNTGLTLAMDFGSDWLTLIKERLSTKFSTLSPKQLDQYDKVCRQAMTRGHQFIYKRLESVTNERKTIRNADLKTELKDFLHKTHPWISEENLSKLHSQSIYYAYKDGLHLCLLD